MRSSIWRKVFDIAMMGIAILFMFIGYSRLIGPIFHGPSALRYLIGPSLFNAVVVIAGLISLLPMYLAVSWMWEGWKQQQ